MRTLFILIIGTVIATSCASTNSTYDSQGRSSDASVRRWKPVKDKTPYYKVMKSAEKN